MQVTVGAEGQVVIPASIREELSIKKGRKLAVYVEEGKIVLEPVEEFIRKKKGSLKEDGKRILECLLEERRKEVEREKLCF